MQAWSSKFYGMKVLSSLTVLRFDSVGEDALIASLQQCCGGANFDLYRAARIYN
jgi:hypothetical protein